MGIQLEDFTKPVAPRKPSEYDPTIEALAEFADHTKAVVITEPEADISKHVRRFREAAKHAGYRSRERSRTKDDKAKTVSVTLTIGKAKSKLGKDSDTDTAAAEAEVESD